MPLLLDITTANIILLGALATFGYVAAVRVWFWAVLLVVVAVAVANVAVVWPDPWLSVFWGLIAVMAVGVAWPVRKRTPKMPERPATRPKKAKPVRRQIALDGTNVMYWDDDTASLDTLQLVVTYLIKRGFEPIVFLDASSRHHLKDVSLTKRRFAQELGLAQRQVMVCPAGTEADTFLLRFAKEQGIAVLSNDRFRDRAQLAEGRTLVKGGIVNGKPVLQGLERA